MVSLCGVCPVSIKTGQSSSPVPLLCLIPLLIPYLSNQYMIYCNYRPWRAKLSSDNNLKPPQILKNLRLCPLLTHCDEKVVHRAFFKS